MVLWPSSSPVGVNDSSSNIIEVGLMLYRSVFSLQRFPNARNLNPNLSLVLAGTALLMAIFGSHIG